MTRAQFIIACLILLSVCATSTAARDIYVDPEAGDDRATGLAARPEDANGPVRTIAGGIALAQPGDTVHLKQAVYRESAQFYNRHGEPGRPITLDGHGATLAGSEPLVPADWREISPGLFRNDQLIRPDLLTRDTAVIGRWFFVFNGRMNHMARTSKGASAPLKRPEELQPGDWTIVQSEHAFYIRLRPGESLAAQRIFAPVRSSGVYVTGDCAHLVIRNVTATHVHNDGYNIHGKSRDCLFEDIAAIECGDDGFSAHDDCEVSVHGFRSIGNSTGICNTGQSTSRNRRVLIRDCLGYDFFVLDDNAHTLEDSVILSSARWTLSVNGRDMGGRCRLKLDNVLIRRVAPGGELRVSGNAELTADRVTCWGLNMACTRGIMNWRRSIIGGSTPVEISLYQGGRWLADHNQYDVKQFRVSNAAYPREKFDSFRAATEQDANSIWSKLTVADDPFAPITSSDSRALAEIGADAEIMKTW